MRGEEELPAGWSESWVWSTVEGGRNRIGGESVSGPGDEAMMAYGGVSGAGLGPSSGGSEVLGSTPDYSPRGTPAPLSHSSGPAESLPLAVYSPQDSPASSAGGGAVGNGQLPSFGFTQEQVACVCEVCFFIKWRFVIGTFHFLCDFVVIMGVEVKEKKFGMQLCFLGIFLN